MLLVQMSMRWSATAQDIGAPFPHEEKLLSRLRNDAEKGLLNGTQWLVKNIEDEGLTYAMEIVPREQPEKEKGLAIDCHAFDLDLRNLFPSARRASQEFDFGYAITCHKSQGRSGVRCTSRTSWCFREDASKWLYTALTRAEERVVVHF